MKVKILFVTSNHGCGNYGCDYDEAARYIKDTDWEEIDDSIFYSLQSYVREYTKSNFKGETAILVRQPVKEEVDFTKTVKQFHEKFERDKKREEKEQEERKNKLKATKQKRELKRLEELKKKYEASNDS